MILDALATLMLFAIIVLVAILVLFFTMCIIIISPIFVLIYAVMETIKRELLYAKKGRRQR
jgi:hypothetical protein